MGSHVTTEILDDLSLRFVINAPEFFLLNPEEYMFIVEEAYWFLTDFYKITELTIVQFAKMLLSHNRIRCDTPTDIAIFNAYKKTIKVYGVMMFSKDFTHVLLVKQKGISSAITFPKGKKSKNETGIECAAREVKEEVGLCIANKIINMPITIFDKITFYVAMNVDMEQPLETRTRNEIEKIFWFPLSEVESIKNNNDYKIFNVAYAQASKLVKKLKACEFKFDVEKILEKVDEALEKNNI
ncbi:mRNA-decapping enzyme subunit 2 [Enteropsectra breve]|nr:mRNA-decapping enzyme subunit 2 [Enteropsectra breve]